jgi:HSP20 family protein
MTTYIPEVNILEKEEHYTLRAELPGVRKEDLEISLEQNHLMIRGKGCQVAENWKPVYREFQDQYTLERSFEIGKMIDREKIQAKMENGVLTLVLPKTEETRPRKIQIQ